VDSYGVWGQTKNGGGEGQLYFGTYQYDRGSKQGNKKGVKRVSWGAGPKSKKGKSLVVHGSVGSIRGEETEGRKKGGEKKKKRQPFRA